MSNTAFYLANASEIALTDAGQLPTEIELMPTGDFRLVDASGAQKHAQLSVTDGAALVERSMASAPGGMLPIDFDHGLDGQGTKSGSAAGWITGLEIKGNRVTASVDWTTLGAEALRGKTYRFISPTFYARPGTGEVHRIARAGLTNTPALPMLKQIASAQDGADEVTLMQAMTIALDLPRDANATEVVAALMSRMTVQAAPATASTGDDEAIPIEVVANYIKDKDAAHIAAMVDMKITAAMQSGRLPPALEDWAKDLAASDMEAFEQVLASSTLDLVSKIVPSGAPPFAVSAAVQSSAASEIERQLGIEPGALSADG